MKLKVGKKIICLILFNPIALYYFIAINYLLKALLFKSVFTQYNSDIERYKLSEEIQRSEGVTFQNG